jgi:hypothetical protein
MYDNKFWNASGLYLRKSCINVQSAPLGGDWDSRELSILGLVPRERRNVEMLERCKQAQLRG